MSKKEPNKSREAKKWDEEAICKNCFLNGRKQEFMPCSPFDTIVKTANQPRAPPTGNAKGPDLRDKITLARAAKTSIPLTKRK